jgi:hypothetical protein
MTYTTVIGLECHVELSTKTKAFCACSTEFGGKPNSHVCPVCIGLPGALPQLNREVVNYALKAGLSTNCKINKVLMGIITVPVEQAQPVCDQLIQCGIKAIWTFAPTHLDVPEHILVQYENMATSLAVLSMHLQAQIKEKSKDN